ncbi:23918_t:CDS:2, partial [Entrophospora sp. SA101]
CLCTLEKKLRKLRKYIRMANKRSREEAHPREKLPELADITKYICGVELPQIVIITSSPSTRLRRVSDKNTKMTARDRDYTYGGFNDESEE